MEQALDTLDRAGSRLGKPAPCRTTSHIARYPLQGPARSLADFEQGLVFCRQRGLARTAALRSRQIAPAYLSLSSAVPRRRSNEPALLALRSRRAALQTS